MMGEEWRDRTALANAQAGAKKPTDEFVARYQAYYGKLPATDEAAIGYWKAFAAKVPADMLDRLFAYVAAEVARRKGGKPYLATFHHALAALRREDNPRSTDNRPRDACALCNGSGWVSFLASVDMSTKQNSLLINSSDDGYVTSFATPCYCNKGKEFEFESKRPFDEVERQAVRAEIQRRGGVDGYAAYTREFWRSRKAARINART
jgi:hypothetical protein